MNAKSELSYEEFKWMDINPVTSWTKSISQQMGQQVGFININSLRAGDNELEKKIIEDVASYGRQLGWITEVLEIVVNKYRKDDNLPPNPEETESLRKFLDLTRKIDDKKKEIRGTDLKSEHPELTTLGELDVVLSDIHAWKERDIDIYNEMVTRIKKSFP